MPITKNALLRYRTIDRCLQNRYRRWTLKDLMESCSNALYEFTGKMENVSRRTVQLDIQKMRSEELGYCAPIVVRENKYYEYENPNYSITNTPLTEQDMEMLSGAVSVLKQLSGFSSFSGMEEIVSKLEDYLGVTKAEHDPVVLYENNDNLRGLTHISVLYDAIIVKHPVLIGYQSFKSRNQHVFEFSPYCLKEFHNRWFVFGKRKESESIINLALDRILSISEASNNATFIVDNEFKPNTYFEDMVGVTKAPNDKPTVIRFKALPLQAQYINTKPLHKSQTIIERCKDGSVIFEINVIQNYEIEKELVSYGETIKVLSPKSLKERIGSRFLEASKLYEPAI